MIKKREKLTSNEHEETFGDDEMFFILITVFTVINI